MDKNFILAFLLSSIVIFGYYSLYPPDTVEQKVITTQVAGEPAAPNQEVAAASVAPANASGIKLSAPEAGDAKLIQIETPLYKAVINGRNGVMESLTLNDYPYTGPSHMKLTNWISSIVTGDDPTPKVYAVDRKVNMVGETAKGQEIWRFAVAKEAEVSLYAADRAAVKVGDKPEALTLKSKLASGLIVQKALTFEPGSYAINVNITLHNPTGSAVAIEPKLYFGTGNEMVETESYPHPKEAGWLIGEDYESADSGDLEDPVEIEAPPLLAGVSSAYFIQGAKMTDGTEFKLNVDARAGAG